MNDQERSELERLKQRQARLEQELTLLGNQLVLLERRLEAPPPEPSLAAPVKPAKEIKPFEIPRKESPPPIPREAPKPVQIEKPPPPVPPVIAVPKPVLESRVQKEADVSEKRPYPEESFSKCVCQACGGHLEFPTSRTGDTIPCPHCGEPALLSTTPAPIRVPPPLLQPAASTGAAPALPARVSQMAEEPAKKGSWEMRLGTHWAPRIGIVLVLTGLVFFGNLAYHNFISKLGPGGKVSLLYLASAVLLGAGAWWQRKAAQQSLKNYAQVLFAGGLAAVYFTTYAAHHLEQVRVIESAGLDGALLLAWAGFMVWCADRKKSEVLALFAVALAYYASIVSHGVGLFTLYSNLLLTAAAVFFLVRNRWATLSFGCLAATYAAYGFWRFLKGNEWHWASPEAGLWTGTYFLMSYWLVFTGGVFLSRDEKFAGTNRASFLTMNNGAFFTLFMLTMAQVRTGGFWKFSLSYGAALLVLAVLARFILEKEPLARNAYLTQGLLLVTVGFISKFAGLQLALILGMESVILLMLGQQRKNMVLLVGAYLSAALAVGWGMDGMRQFDRAGLWLAAGLGILMLANTLLTHRQIVSEAAEGAESDSPPAAGARATVFRPQPGYFTVLALIIWFAATWDNTAREHCPLALAVEAALFIFSYYALRVPEISLLGQGYLLLAQSVWIYDAFAGTQPPPRWDAVLMMAGSIGLSHWWLGQKILELRSHPDPSWKALARLPVVGKNLVLFVGMTVGIQLAGGWGRTGAGQPGLYLPVGLGALVLGDALLAHWRMGAPGGLKLRWQPSYSTALALAVWFAVTYDNTSHANFPLVLAGEAVLLTLSFYALRVPEIALLGQGYMVLAQAARLGYFVLNPKSLPPWWNPLLLIALNLGLGHWWQKQKALELRSQFGLLCQGLYSLAIIGVLCVWLSPQVEAPGWLALTSLLAVGVTAYGVFTRAWFLAAYGQIFLAVSVAQFAVQLAQGKPHWPLPLAPVAALGFLSLATVKWFQVKPDPTARASQPLLQIALLYRWVALVMSIWWICEYIPERERIWLLALLGLWVFLWAGLKRSREALLFSGAFTAAALVLFWEPLMEPQGVYWPNLMVIILLLGQRQAARRMPDRYPLSPATHGAVIVIGGMSLWLFLSRWVLKQESGFYLTASWSALALALFTAGIVLRERMYRWVGLGILACALGRVIIFDVWKLETIFRVLSIMALGIVLLVFGFVYNRYQEKIREWL